jgi:hypothetical protein
MFNPNRNFTPFPYATSEEGSFQNIPGIMIQSPSIPASPCCTGGFNTNFPVEGCNANPRSWPWWDMQYGYKIFAPIVVSCPYRRKQFQPYKPIY